MLNPCLSLDFACFEIHETDNGEDEEVVMILTLSNEELVLEGDIYDKDTQLLVAELNKTLQHHTPNNQVIVDMAKVTFVSTKVLRVLLDFYKESQGLKKTVIFRGVKTNIMESFRMIGLDQLFTFE